MGEKLAWKMVGWLINSRVSHALVPVYTSACISPTTATTGLNTIVEPERVAMVGKLHSKAQRG